MRVFQRHAGDDAKLLIKFHWPKRLHSSVCTCTSQIVLFHSTPIQFRLSEIEVKESHREGGWVQPMSNTRGLEWIIAHHIHFYTRRHVSTWCNTISINVGAYFLSNSLHSNARKYTSHNIPYTLPTTPPNSLLGCATTEGWLLLMIEH